MLSINDDARGEGDEEEIVLDSALLFNAKCEEQCDLINVTMVKTIAKDNYRIKIVVLS